LGWIAIADLSQSPQGVPRAVKARVAEASAVVVPSPTGAAAAVLRNAGQPFTSYLDYGMTPDAPASQVVDTMRELCASGGVVLAVAGYPFLREGIVTGLLHHLGPVEVLPADSPLEVLLLAFDVDVTADLDLVDAGALKTALPDRGAHLIVTGITNVITARTVSKRLSDLYPGDHPAVVAVHRPGAGYELHLSTVASLDAQKVSWPDSTVYVSPVRIAPPGGFYELVRIMAILRAPDGCPWDLEQTHMSLRRHLIEEAYETTAAIEAGDMDGLADELGDILLQVVFHAQIATENGDFTIDDSVSNIIAKLRRRHPHIFGNATAETPDEVMDRWDSIKREERGGGSILDGIAPTLPALTYADKMSRRAVAVGFEWETIEDVWLKVHEEIDELRATEPDTPEAADEVGDLLFTIVNVARKMGIDPEGALRSTCDKFQRRFADMEKNAAQQGKQLGELDIDDMEALWRLAKESERGESDS
jgi:tetrapyrrole methylase family protein / MazG family protein